MAIITISRQYGSGGDEIASRLCELLGYQLFDKQMMAQLAAEANLSPAEVIDSPEDRHEVLTWFERIFGNKVAEAWVSADEETGSRTVEIGEVDGRHFIAEVSSLLQAAQRRGNVVVLGRGGQVVLKGQPDVLSVRIEAPFAERVRRVSEQQRFANPQAARDFVAGRDRAGADYLRTYYHADWADPLLYHLVLNTGLWGIEAAAQVIVDALKSLPVAVANR